MIFVEFLSGTRYLDAVDAVVDVVVDVVVVVVVVRFT